MLEFEVVRTAEVIAQEIREIKEQTCEAVISGTIEIGKRLCEAKALVAVGSWGDWLRDNVSYSERTAQNMMAVYKEYGKRGVPEGLRNASLTNAIAMLGLPEDVKHELIDSGAPESMSTRELKEEIARLTKEKEEKQQTIFSLLEEKKERETDSAAFDRAKKEYEAKLSDMRVRLSEATASAGAAQDAALKASEKAIRAEEALQEKKRELEAAKNQPMEPAIIEKVPDEVERELAELRSRVRQNTSAEMTLFRDCYSRLVETFKRCIELTEEVARVNGDEEARKLRAAIARSARQMAEQAEK